MHDYLFGSLADCCVWLALHASARCATCCAPLGVAHAPILSAWLAHRRTTRAPAARVTAAPCCAMQAEVDKLYLDQDEWTRRSILYTAGSGFFSSDRTIKQYADEIWDVKPMPLPSS